MAHSPPASRLYLVAPRMESGAVLGFLEPVLAAADIAAVLLRSVDGGERAQINYVKAIAPAVQRNSVAVLLDGLPDLVARAGADGAHVTGVADLRVAVAALKPDRIVGCGGLGTRHDAMVAGEAGADYVMFGEFVAGRRPPFETTVERVSWWAQLFETPCVGWAESVEEAEVLARAGAEFVAVGERVLADSRGAVAAVMEAERRMASAGAPA